MRSVTCFGMLVLSSALIAQEAKPDEKARAIVGEFIKAFKAKNLEAMMKTVDVPWYEQGREIIKGREQLEAVVKKELDRLDDPNKVPSDILEVVRFADYRDRLGNEAKIADEVMAKEDPVVLLGRGGKEAVALFVKMKKGEAKVIGITR